MLFSLSSQTRRVAENFLAAVRERPIGVVGHKRRRDLLDRADGLWKGIGARQENRQRLRAARSFTSRHKQRRGRRASCAGYFFGSRSTRTAQPAVFADAAG